MLHIETSMFQGEKTEIAITIADTRDLCKNRLLDTKGGSSALVCATEHNPIEGVEALPQILEADVNAENNITQAVFVYGASKEYLEIDEITDEMIPESSVVVFDWDNTLKIINRKDKKISSRVSPMFLENLKKNKHCQLFILSAIRPSKLNLETILIEVDRLGLRDVFVPKNTREDVKSNLARLGNIVICGYDKAETLLMLINEMQEPCCSCAADSPHQHKVVLFDDEYVNIKNFLSIIPGSICYWIH